MSYINTVDYAGWHLPCYANHNCPKRLVSNDAAGVSDGGTNHYSAGAGRAPLDLMTMGNGDSGLVSGFLWCLVFVSIFDIVVVFAVLGSLRFRRPLNLFLLSVLLSDVVITLVVMPLHAIHTANMASGEKSCMSWMYAHLVAVCAR
jgi:hypothetical protein